MTTDELLEALKPYTVELSWGDIIQKWFVVLWDYDALTFYADDKRAALQAAWEAIKVNV